MTDARAVVQRLSRHVDEKHGIVDVNSAMKDLDHPQDDLKTVLADPTVPEWHFYALEGLRSLAATGNTSPEDGRIILEGTKRIAQRLGTDEFYKTFDAMAHTKKNASLLADFANDMLNDRDQRDWLWLAFSAVGTLLQHNWSDAITEGLRWKLMHAVREQQADERESQMAEKRESEMREIIGQIISRTSF
jgi:hypothetical protein